MEIRLEARLKRSRIELIVAVDNVPYLMTHNSIQRVSSCCSAKLEPYHTATLGWFCQICGKGFGLEAGLAKNIVAMDPQSWDPQEASARIVGVGANPVGSALTISKLSLILEEIYPLTCGNFSLETAQQKIEEAQCSFPE